MNIKNSELIVVHTMGKVGSSSIEQTLKEIDLGIPIYHTHYLNQERLNIQIEARRRSNKNYSLIGNLKICQNLINQLKTYSIENKKWKIITLVREPISRNISAFFQNWQTSYPIDFKKYESGELTLEDLTKVFLDRYPHNTPLQWLDKEIKDVFNIDPFSEKFPLENGYHIMSKSNFDLMIIKLDNLSSCCKIAFEEFLGIKDFQLVNYNVGINKGYAETYKKFKETIKFPDSYIEKMYNSKFINHFYSPEEINLFTKKWRKL